MFAGFFIIQRHPPLPLHLSLSLFLSHISCLNNCTQTDIIHWRGKPLSLSAFECIGAARPPTLSHYVLIVVSQEWRGTASIVLSQHALQHAVSIIQLTRHVNRTPQVCLLPYCTGVLISLFYTVRDRSCVKFKSVKCVLSSRLTKSAYLLELLTSQFMMHFEQYFEGQNKLRTNKFAALFGSSKFR